MLFNRRLADTIAEPDAATDTLARRTQSSKCASHSRRLIRTLQLEMGSAEGGMLGIGELDDARFAPRIDLLGSIKNLPHHPTVQELFSRSFLPPLNEQVRSLVQL